MYTGVFQSKEESICYLLLKEIDAYNGPVGSWTLKELLDGQGKHFSTATIGRYLKLLDGNDYTIRESNKGRIVTEKGSRWLDEMAEQLARAEIHDEASQAMRVNKYDDLIDLMEARKAIEVTAACLAAKEHTQEELLTLHRATNVYYRYISEKKEFIDPALEFHALVTSMSHNKYIKNLLDILIFEEKQMEANIENLSTRSRGANYVIQHDDIAEAIGAGDEKLAGELMGRHIDSIIDDLKKQIKEIEEGTVCLQE